MVKEPEDYLWSGHRAYLGVDVIPWLTTDWVLSQFSMRLGVARRAYERFVLKDKGGSRQEEYHRGAKADSRILGDDTFIDRVLGQKEEIPRRKGSLEHVLKEVCKGYSVKKEELGLPGKDHRLSEARGMAAWLVMELGVCTLAELGKVTGRDVSTLSSAAKRLQMRAKADVGLTKQPLGSGLQFVRPAKGRDSRGWKSRHGRSQSPACGGIAWMAGGRGNASF